MARIRPRLKDRLMALVALGGLGACSLSTPLPPPTEVPDRLAMLPRVAPALTDSVRVHWSAEQIPFIVAESDHDAAFTLGLVNAHLRLGQMEIMRRIAQGRLAEMGGPFAAEIDHALRILDLDRAAPAVVAGMPVAERAWVEAFIAGVNYAQATMDPLPHEFGLLNLRREPWKAEDIVAIGRLGSVDVNWILWLRLLQARQRPDWPEIWQTMLTRGVEGSVSFDLPADPKVEALADALMSSGKTGSNSFVVGAERSANGHALMANDPHLGLNLPNLWLIAGVKSPSYHMVGLMVPALPFVAVGRNPWIAWGGTNLRAASSDLFRLSPEEVAELTERTEVIRQRWWFDDEVTIRESRYGPVISDAPPLDVPPGEVLALRWIGHRPSDEITAMLRVNRARNWEEFRSALAGFALSPQNMLYADVEGNIGQVTATHLPRRAMTPPADLVTPPEGLAAWDDIVTSDDLPTSFNPPQGFLASANNRPSDSRVPIGWFFSGDDRIGRLKALLSEPGPIDRDRLAQIQQDTYRASAHALAQAFSERLRASQAAQAALTPAARTAWDRLAAWNGRYDVDSEGALVFEVLAAHLLEVGGYTDGQRFHLVTSVGEPWDLFRVDLPGKPDQWFDHEAPRGLALAAQRLERHGNWGGFHRLAIQHLLGALPLIGGRYRFDEVPTAGSTSTVHKSAHDITTEPHTARYGANSRHISDMGDPDANWFVLVGGQDGWFNSSTFRDQVALWQRGEAIPVPLTVEGVAARFPHLTVIRPND